MASNAGRFLNAFFWILLNATFIGCQNANITASNMSLIERESLTLTCTYIGSKTETVVLWYNKTTENFLALEPNTSISGICDFFTKGPSFQSTRVTYGCSSTNNIYTLTIASVQMEDAGLWSCTFQDPFTVTPESTIHIQITAATTTSSTTPVNGNTGGAIVGGTTGCVFFIAIIIGGVLVYM